MNTQQLIHEFPKGIIKWYEFHKGAKTLLITHSLQQEMNYEVIHEGLQETGLAVSCIDTEDVFYSENKLKVYKYIILLGCLEYCKEPEKLLAILRKHLASDGKLLLGMDNRLGIRYFCGDRDAFTNRNFDGIENYYKINKADYDQLKGRAYSKAEIENILDKAGFDSRKFYSVLPNLSMPQLIYAEDYLPEEELEVRFFPSYRTPDTVFLEEEKLYNTLVQNGLFHIMANSFFIECSLNNEFMDVKHVTLSMDRGKEFALATIITGKDTVIKKALYEEGKERLKKLIENNEDLKAHGVAVVEGHIEQDMFIMPYIKGEIVTNYFRRIIKEDPEIFLKELDSFRDIIFHSSDIISYDEVDWDKMDPDWERRKPDDPNREQWKKVAFSEKSEYFGPVLKRGYIDLVSLNCFKTEEGFLFYDQEFYYEQLPANVILYRTISLIYGGDAGLESAIPRKVLMDRYGLGEYEQFWNRYSTKFTDVLCNKKELGSFYSAYRRNVGIVHSNRQRMNYSESEYQAIFKDILENLEDKKLYLFGSGRFTMRFLEQFEGEVEVEGILDNSSEKWGTRMYDIPIFSPDILKNMEADSYKVIICIKNYVGVMRQLKELGVKHYGVYDWSIKYPRKKVIPKVPVSVSGEEVAAPKKYHVGYIAGVFDLFHVGHLNMFKRAKEQCDYLIVGVVSDESVRKNKKTNPYIPFEERIEIVRSCRYVDEAVKIGANYGGSESAYSKYHFDVQFSGSDYENNPDWLAVKAYLQSQGSDLVFFPYTQSTSSTKIKEKISRR